MVRRFLELSRNYGFPAYARNRNADGRNGRRNAETERNKRIASGGGDTSIVSGKRKIVASSPRRISEDRYWIDIGIESRDAKVRRDARIWMLDRDLEFERGTAVVLIFSSKL